MCKRPEISGSNIYISQDVQTCKNMEYLMDKQVLSRNQTALKNCKMCTYWSFWQTNTLFGQERCPRMWIRSNRENPCFMFKMLSFEHSRIINCQSALLPSQISKGLCCLFSRKIWSNRQNNTGSSRGTMQQPIFSAISESQCYPETLEPSNNQLALNYSSKFCCLSLQYCLYFNLVTVKTFGV